LINPIEQQIEHFNQIASEYYNARQNPKSSLLYSKIWETVFNNHVLRDLKHPIKVLDAMCGFAIGYDILKENLKTDFSYSGFDYSEEMMHYASQRNPSLRLFVCDILNYRDEDTYDIILLIGGLHHVYTFADQAVSNISKALKPGGFFINFEPTNNNLLWKWIRDRIYKKNRVFDADTEKAFTIKELHTIAQNNNLNVVDELYPGLLAYVLWYNPDAFPSLNLGSLSFVSWLCKMESHIWRTCFARYFSFATLTIYKK
jgi:SAM-dependent methyltransferase